MQQIPPFGPPWLTLLAGVGGCVAVGLLSGAFTRTEISGWYASLAKPSFNPPNWIFGRCGRRSIF